MWQKPYSFAKFANSASENWGPLSDTATSGIPCRAKTDLQWAIRFLAERPTRWASSGSEEAGVSESLQREVTNPPSLLATKLAADVHEGVDVSNSLRNMNSVCDTHYGTCVRWFISRAGFADSREDEVNKGTTPGPFFMLEGCPFPASNNSFLLLVASAARPDSYVKYRSLTLKFPG